MHSCTRTTCHTCYRTHLGGLPLLLPHHWALPAMPMQCLQRQRFTGEDTCLPHHRHLPAVWMYSPWRTATASYTGEEGPFGDFILYLGLPDGTGDTRLEEGHGGRPLGRACHLRCTFLPPVCHHLGGHLQWACLPPTISFTTPPPHPLQCLSRPSSLLPPHLLLHLPGLYHHYVAGYLTTCSATWLL